MARAGSPMERMLSTSPPPQPLSKRDKRRNNITEKLADMVQTFSREQYQHYRAQLQAIQVDMTLVLRADPYENVPLDDSADAILHQIETVTGGSLPNTEGAQRDYLALAGNRYHDYVQEINRSMEQRDADLTALKNRYENAVSELEKTTSYKLAVAQREHLELAGTIRQRLINSVTKKRDKLLREKEQLDIADSNSLLLHPSQFSMNVPGSPGGAQSNRKTRHTRHRIGDPDEVLGERGRKRKAPADDEGNESPIPSFRPLPSDMAGASSPFRDARAKTLYSQYEAPAYSIDRLFTEKELAHATNVAQLATHQLFHQPPQQAQSNGVNHTNGATNSVPSVDGSADAIPPTIITDDEVVAQANGSPAPQAADMERTVSYHATRNATKANPLSFLSEAAAAASSNLTNPFIPNLIPITKTDKGAPAPPSMNAVDVDNDMALMMRDDDAAESVEEEAYDGARNDNSMRALRDRLLDQAVSAPGTTAPFRLPILEVGPAQIRGGVNRTPMFGFADPDLLPQALRAAAGGAPPSVAVPATSVPLGGIPAGGLPMSRATSMAGSDVGGGSEAGGVGMRRVRNRLV